MRELKEKLEAFEDEALVWVEGCDCTGPAGDVVDDSDVEMKVLITRVGY